MPKPVRKPPCFYRPTGRWLALHLHAVPPGSQGVLGMGDQPPQFGRGPSLRDRFGHDPAVIFQAYLILTLWLLGYADQSAIQIKRLRAMIPSWSHPPHWPTHMPSLPLPPASVGMLQPPSTRRRRRSTSAAHGLPSWSALAAALQGWALLQQGRVLGGLDQEKAGTTAWNTEDSNT